jgi:hypothetical protein
LFRKKALVSMSKKVLVPICVELRIENRNFHANRSRMKKDSAESVFDLDRGEATRQPVVHCWHDGVVEHVGVGEALRAAGVLVGGAGITVAANCNDCLGAPGEAACPGWSLCETQKFLAGLAIIDVPNLDAALEWAARNPAASCASVEVRPLLGWSGQPDAWAQR